MSVSTPQIAIKLPHGEVANFQEMQVYGQTLQRFVREQEAGLAQIEDTQHHDQIIDYLQLLARSYNEQLRLYKAAEAQRQKAILVVLLRIGGSPDLQ